MRDRPAVKVLIPYLFGIILADGFNLNSIYLWFLSAISMVLLFVLYRKSYLSASSFLLTLSLLAIGFLRYESAMIPPRGLHEVLYNQVKVQGTVMDSQKERSGGSSLILNGKANLTSNSSISMTGKIYIRSWDDEGVFPQKYGDIVEVKGLLSRSHLPRNPGVFDYRKYLMRRGIFAAMTVDDISNVRTIGTGGNFFLGWVKGLRQRIEGIVDETMPSAENAAILKGVTLGDREDLSEEVYKAFLRTGTTHILVVSGLNIGIIAGWAFLLCNRIRRQIGIENKAAAYIPIIPLVIIYACMVGFQASVVRASIFAILAILAVIIDRDRGGIIDYGEDGKEQVVDLLNLLAVAALCILIYRPGAFWDAGFQLSFGTVASISYLMPHWGRWLGRVRSSKWYSQVIYRILQSITISLSAQIGSMLIIAYYFKRVSLAGIFANPIIIPIVALITPIAFVSSFAGLIYLPLARIFAYVNNILISILRSIIFYFAKFRWAQVSERHLSSFWYLVFCIAAIVFIANLPVLLKEKRKLIIASLGVLAIFVWATALSYDGHILRVTYLDVGQGDSEFVELPDGNNILIDGGPYDSRFDTGERVIAPFLQHRGVGKVDLMVSSHPHNDHAGGLTHIVDSFRVGEAMTGSYGLTTPTFEELRACLDRGGVKHSDAQLGIISRGEDVLVEVVGPQAPCTSGDEDVRMNENSVVLRVTYKGVSFLFAADIGEKSECLLIDSVRDIRAAVMKVPHQGSQTSSSWRFLRAVQPAIGIISVGRRNMFGHPSSMILGRYKWLGIRTYRTDRQGAITVITDGRRGWVRPML